MSHNQNKSVDPLPRPNLTLPLSTSRTVHSHLVEAGPIGRFHEYRGAALFALTVFVVWLNLSFLKPLVMGCIFAIVLFPLLPMLEAWFKSVVTRAVFITIGFAVIFLIPIAILVVLGADAALERVQSLQSIDLGAGDLSPMALAERFGIRPWIEWVARVSPISETQILQHLTRAIVSLGGMLAHVLQELLTNLPGVIFANIVILFTIFTLLIDGPRAIAFVRENSFFGPEETDRIFENVSQLCQSVIVATVVSGAIQSLLIGISLLITGTENVLLIVLVAFMASFFPVVGTAPVTIFLTLQAFLTGNVTHGLIFLVFIGLVGISDNLVRPYVMKGGAELHPLVGFVAAFAALDSLGFYGLFIGPVAAGLFFTLLPMVTRSYARASRGVLR